LKDGNWSFRRRLHDGLRQRGSAFGAAFYGQVGNPALPEFGGGAWRWAGDGSLCECPLIA